MCTHEVCLAAFFFLHETLAQFYSASAPVKHGDTVTLKVAACTQSLI